MERSFRNLAKEAKKRMKEGFWADFERERDENIRLARLNGVSGSRAEHYFTAKVSEKIRGEEEDEFYEKVKEMLLSEGEVSDAIGRLTDKEYYATLSYEEKQRYTLTLSERYLAALERFRRECEFMKKK